MSLRNPKKYVLTTCPVTCSFNHHNIGKTKADYVHQLINSGVGERVFIEKCLAKGISASKGAFYRHRTSHMVLESVQAEQNAAEEQESSLSHLEIVESIIRRGAKNLMSSRVTPKETMEALNLYYRLTAGSAFEDMLDALSGVVLEDDDDSTSV